MRDLAARFEEAADAMADEEQVKLRLRLARIHWDQLKNPDMAKRAYRAVLDLDASNKDAHDALEGIYEGELDHPQRMWSYRRQYDVSPYAGEKISYAFKIAGVLSDNLGDLPGAVEAVKRILDMEKLPPTVLRDPLERRFRHSALNDVHRAGLKFRGPAPVPAPSADPVPTLFREFLAARSTVGLPTDGITETEFRAGLEKQRKTQSERLGVPDVAFSVAVRDGKVVLLARPADTTGKTVAMGD